MMKNQTETPRTYKSVSTALAVGTAVADITPPLEVGLLVSSVEERWLPFQSVRLPLKARVIVFESGYERMALVSLDLLGLNSTAVGGWEKFKCTLSGEIDPERIIITCTHTHNAPESLALTDLYQSKPFRAWLEQLQSKIAQAIREATAKTCFCAVTFGVTELQGFSLQRRIPVASGVVMSDTLQPISQELLSRRPVDRRIHGIWLRTPDGSPIATIVHAVCHPVHEMCRPQISPDFPGEVCTSLDSSSINGMTLFLNGAAGDINPTTVSWGAEYSRQHGLAIAEAVEKASYKAKVIEAQHFVFCQLEVKLPIRSLKGMLNQQENCVARLSGIRLGSLAIIFLPGEPFVETALEIEHASPFKQTLIVAFAESSIGYIPPERAFMEGGYEVGPGKWSFLQAGSDLIIRQKALEILHELKQEKREN